MHLPLLAQLDMPQRMCPNIKEHSLGLPRRLRRLSGGPPLHLRHPGDALNLSLLLLRRSTLSNLLFFEAFYTPEEVARSPEGVFGGRNLSPICGPVGFRGRAPHHKPIHPELLHHFSAISHGDSSVRPPFHSPRRLDDLRSSGRIPPSSDPSGITSVSSLHHGRSLLSVQGAVLRADNCPAGLYTADGSNIRHSPSLRYQDAQISRRLVDSSQIQDRLSPGEGQAPSSVRGAGTTSHFQEVVLDPISGHDLSRHADPVSSVRRKTDRDKGRKSPQDHRGVSFIPRPPSSSLAPSSGPPFVPYSSGKGWDVKDAVSPDSPQVQVGLPRRIASHPLGSSVSGGSFMVVWGDSKTRGRRSFPPRARLELLLGRVRRRLGHHRRGTPSVRSLDSKPKGTLHQPQGDDGSAERLLRVQLATQRQDDRSLLRQCHDSRLPQAIGRHEVSGPVPQSKRGSPVDVFSVGPTW